MVENNKVPPAEEGGQQGVGHDKENAKQQKSTLESIIDESISAVKAGFNLGVAAIAPAVGYALTGNPGVLATSASFVLGTRGRKDSKVIRNKNCQKYHFISLWRGIWIWSSYQQHFLRSW